MSSLFHNCGWKSKELSIYVITRTSAFICKSDILHCFTCAYEVKPQFFINFARIFLGYMEIHSSYKKVQYANPPHTMISIHSFSRHRKAYEELTHNANIKKNSNYCQFITHKKVKIYEMKIFMLLINFHSLMCNAYVRILMMITVIIIMSRDTFEL